MVGVQEVLLKSGESWLHYAAAHTVISVSRASEVRPALREVEELVASNGWHAAGFVGYEAASGFDSALETRKSGDFPLLWFGLYPPPRSVDLPAAHSGGRALQWRASLSRPRYRAAIGKIRSYIAQGYTYQVNFTIQLHSRFDGRPWDFFLRLAQQPAPYAAYIDTGKFAICSASPELFFQVHGSQITSRPMKGTARRGRTTAEDLELALQLEASAKDRAENVMITDMIRNDIGRIARNGTVRVPRLFSIEKYPTLFQMTSTVSAQTDASVDEIFAALFPCASISGAPKVSTMRIISELETRPRRIYTGAVGSISPERNARFSVAIRTALIDKKRKLAEYGVGGGVVWDSTADAEYAEAMLKAVQMTEPRPSFSILETVLWTPQLKYFLLGRHLERMRDSAQYFSFPFDDALFAQELEGQARSFRTAQRVRVLLNQSGLLTIASARQAKSPLRIGARMAEQPVDSSDAFLFHKTTNRTAIDAVRPRAAHDDFLMFNERAEVTEFSTGNLVFQLRGARFTPPVSSGLLAGSLRAELLARGEIQVRLIHARELARCEKLWRINSVRGWQEVTLMGAMRKRDRS